MKPRDESLARRAHKDRRGQILPLVALSLVVLLGFAGLVIDAGQLYYSLSELQASTNAAALAGAQSLPNSSATTAATAFSSVTGGKNVYSNLPNVSMAPGYPVLECLSTLTGEGIPCVAPASANAIVVRQQVSVPTTFMRLFGTTSLTLTATSTASMRGSARSPYNVVILVDATGSMNDTDQDSQCKSSRISCALAGVQILLSELSPCASSESSCGSVTKNSSGGGGNVANAVDRISLSTFPPVLGTSASSDYTCSGSVSTEAYNFAGAKPTYFLPATSTYQVVNFSSDYRSSDTATSLNSSSNIVTAVGTTKSTGCLEQALYPNTQNVLIVLSDGDATATTNQSSGNKADLLPVATLTTTGLYPSSFYECQQAITAAQAATAAGTRVYTVAYGAEASGCLSDNTACGKGVLGGDCVPTGNKLLTNTPCTTMQQMASNSSTFFSDYTATGSSGSCISASRPTTNLNEIFTEIAGDLTVARLIPNGTP
jgi:Flp pilus assembly protein TadG